jgi:hypothetical protein
VALIDGIAIQVLRSGKPLSPKEQRALIDGWIVTWLRPTRRIGKAPAATGRTYGKTVAPRASA